MLNIKLHIYFFLEALSFLKIIGIVIIFIIDYTKIQRTKNLWDGIKTLFLKKYIIYISEALNDELKDANKLYNED